MADFVLDASVAAAWCFTDETTPYTEGVLSAVSGQMDATVPRLWAYEIRNSVLRGVQRKRIMQADADSFLQSLPDLCISLTDPVSYDSLFALAIRHGLTVYDAAYLDLAIRESLPLATLDNALIRAAGQSNVELFRP